MRLLPDDFQLTSKQPFGPPSPPLPLEPETSRRRQSVDWNEPDLPTADLQPIKLEKKGITGPIQGELGSPEALWRETVAVKLDQSGNHADAAKLRACCSQVIIRTCKGCGDRETFFSHCDNFFCPACAHRLAKRRKKQVEWWTKLVRQPKHVVLTVRNTWQLTDYYIAACKKALRNLRRSKFARGWRGGCWTLEITNEGKGWHLHFHLLVDADYIDSQQLAKAWAKQVMQDFSIVKVKDVRQSDYLREVCKYVVKGSEIATWTAIEVGQFVSAFKNQRTFGIFGSLYAQNAEWKKTCEELSQKACTCPMCNSMEFQYLEESEFVWRQTVHGFG